MQIDADVVWFAVVQLIPPTVMLLIQGFAASRVLSMRPIFGWAESLDLIRESLPQTGVLVIAVLYWRADGVILSLLSVSSEVGVYGLAYTLAFTTLVLSQFFLKSTLSTMTEEFNRAPEVFARLIRRGVEVMFVLGVPIGVIGAVLAGPIIKLISSEEFVARGEPTLALLMLAVGVRFVGGTLGQALFAAHDQTYLFRLMIATLALNVGLNVALAGRFGAVGAAAALLATELIGTVFATRRLGRRCKYRTPWLFLVRLAVPLGLAVAAAVVLGGAHVVLAALFAAAAYVGGNYYSGPWESQRSNRFTAGPTPSVQNTPRNEEGTSDGEGNKPGVPAPGRDSAPPFVRDPDAERTLSVLIVTYKSNDLVEQCLGYVREYYPGCRSTFTRTPATAIPGGMNSWRAILTCIG